MPNTFFRKYASLKPRLTPGEALFVLHLMTYKWDAAAPYPTYRKLSEAMGVSEKMARRYAQSLQKKGYLMRQFQERAANRFDLTGLFNALIRKTDDVEPHDDLGEDNDPVDYSEFL